jgi:hypothetical protein
MPSEVEATPFINGIGYIDAFTNIHRALEIIDADY